MDATPADKPQITIDDFAKLDLRVGTVVEASPHPNADRLLVLKVDLGERAGGVRQICAGIKAQYAPETLVGTQIVVVANLAPRDLRGQTSHGMLLAASTDDRSQLALVRPEKPIDAGASVG